MATIIFPTTITPAVPEGGTARCTLAEAERETASRVGPFFDLTASGGGPDSITIPALRSTAPQGGYEGLWLLRRDAVVDTDRVRIVQSVNFPTGALVVDFPYSATALNGERIELHHLHPDTQLYISIQSALRRCWVLDVLPIALPTDGLNGVTARTNGWQNGRALIYEVTRSAPDTLRENWAPLTNRSMSEPGSKSGVGGGGVGAILDLTSQAFWLTAARQVLAVAVDGMALPGPGRYGDSGGWSVYAARGRVYLSVPAGSISSAQSVDVRCYRDAFALVNDGDDPAGPVLDDDVLGVPLDYVCAFAHAEAWRRYRDRLEASAAEGRFAPLVEVAAEATRVASQYADWLFRPNTERGDAIASPWGNTTKTSATGLGGWGVLTGAVVNQNDTR